MQTTTESKIEAVKNQVGDVLIHHQATFCNREALKALLVEAEKQILTDLQHHSAPQPLHIPNSTSYPFLMLQTPAFQGYAINRIILELLEASPAWKEANAILEPLVSELAKLEAQLAAEVAERGARQVRLNAAKEAALAKAQAQALLDPEFIKAEKALLELDQPAKSKAKVPDSIGEVS